MRLWSLSQFEPLSDHVLTPESPSQIQGRSENRDKLRIELFRSYYSVHHGVLAAPETRPDSRSQSLLLILRCLRTWGSGVYIYQK